MRASLFALALVAAGLGACTSTGSGSGSSADSGLSETFDSGNYRRSTDTNGTQLRPDVNRTYTAPVVPSIANRGF